MAGRGDAPLRVSAGTPGDDKTLVNRFSARSATLYGTVT
jgi:hypothetical protein